MTLVEPRVAVTEEPAHSYYVQYHFCVEGIDADQADKLIDKMVEFAESVQSSMTCGSYPLIAQRWLFNPVFADFQPVDEFVIFLDRTLAEFDGQPKRMHTTAIMYSDDDIFEWEGEA
jgi:hypothetical protein